MTDNQPRAHARGFMLSPSSTAQNTIMLSLKEYQQRALDALSEYFRKCVGLNDANLAFYDCTRTNFGQGIPYNEVKELPGLPYVCLRIPTGGGKTLVACHSIAKAARELSQTDCAVVLWLVPSNAIREQTLKALRDNTHAYHQALKSELGSIAVLDLSEALYVSRSTLKTDTTIIIATMQAFRVEETDGRKVYESSGVLQSHFVDLPEDAFIGLERRTEDGSIIYSLANVLRLYRPVTIVDEAHNARTSLSFETLARFRPSCIIEFTATPATEDHPSNILYSVSAAELKAEEMIKLPIKLEAEKSWKEILSDAVSMRQKLEEIARTEQQITGEYIRPIMLLQAQPRRQDKETLTVEVVEKCLLEDHRIPPEQIVRATGTDRGLDDVEDILASSCPIRFVITVQALREGWDCPFAYVLCSVTELSSSTAVEQILGRVMRLPRARKKTQEELNAAYAFVASQSFAQTANALADTLVKNLGFERQEAKDIIEQMPKAQSGDLFDRTPLFAEIATVTIQEKPVLSTLSPNIAEKISFDEKTNAFSFSGAMTEAEREDIAQCFTDSKSKMVIAQLYETTNKRAEEKRERMRDVVFKIPALAIKQGDFFEMFEETHFLEHDWSLKNADAVLSEAEFSTKPPQGKLGEIDITGQGHIETRYIANVQEQMKLLSDDSNWTVANLVHWLDRAIPHPDIDPTESGIFLTRVVNDLIDVRGLSLSFLVREKYRLKDSVEKKINSHRLNARTQSFQSMLFEDRSPLTVTPEICFSFDPNIYPCNTRYRGSFRFNKHYYEMIGDMNGEETECAMFLEAMPEVVAWVRNLERRPSHSFWLQTSTDKFYPDFVCLLNDGRYLVIEYKGADRWSDDDSKEKRGIGELWEVRSDGKCLFVMPQGKDFTKISNAIC